MERGVVALMVPAVHHGSKHGARYFKADHVVQALAVPALPCAAEVAPHICLDPPLTCACRGYPVRDLRGLSLLFVLAQVRLFWAFAAGRSD